MNRLQKIAMLILVFSLVFSTPTVSVGAEKVRISIWGWPVWPATMEKIVPLFNEKYPDIEVDIVSIGSQDVHTKLLTSLASGSGAPDVAFVDMMQISNFMTIGGLTDLSKEPFNAGQHAHNFFPHKWSAGWTPDGRLIGVPPNVAPHVMWYNAKVFNEAGISINDQGLKDWDEFLLVGQKITRDTDGDGKADLWMLDHARYLGQQIINSQPGFFDRDGNIVIDNSDYVRALEYALEARRLGIDARVQATTNEWNEGIRRDSLATILRPAWHGGHLTDYIIPGDTSNWRGAWPPGKMAGTDGGVFMVIPEQSKNKEAAWKLVEFVTTNIEAQKIVFTFGAMLPAWLPTYEDPVFEEALPFYGGQQIRLLWRDIAFAIPDLIRTPYDVIARDLVYDALLKTLETGTAPEKTLGEAKALLQQRIRRR